VLDRDGLIDCVRSYFATIEDVRLVLVFGSVANGHFGPSSDLDVAIAGSSRFSQPVLEETRASLSSLTGREVDLVDLEASEGLVVYEAVVHGVRVKLDREAFVKHHAKALSYREDFLPLRRALQDARIRRFIGGS